MHHIPLSVSDDLHLDMPIPIDSSLLGEDLLRRALLNRSRDGTLQLIHISDQTDASSASAINSFDHDRETILRGKLPHLLHVSSGLRESW